MDLERHSLQAYLGAFAWTLLVAGLLPFGVRAGEALWIWDGLADAGPADGAALCAPLCGAIAFWALSRLRASKAAKSALLLGLLGCGWLASVWADRAAHPLPVFTQLGAGLPPVFGQRLGLLLGGLALTAAGLRLGACAFVEPRQGRPALADAWPAARLLTSCGILLVLLLYALPRRGEIPLVESVLGLAASLSKLDDARSAAVLAGQVLSLGPLGLALASTWRLLRPAPARGGSLSGFLLAYLPCLCAVVGLRSLPDAPASSLVHLRSAALLLTLIAGVATALPAMLRGLLFEIPWLFGRLGRTDDLLAAALSEPDSALGLHRSMGRLDPLARIFVRRRLALWRSAAQGVPGVKEADLARVIRILEQRWREEAREANPQAEPATGTGRWPWWMRPGVPSVGLSLLLAAAAFGAAVRWRADPNEQPSGLCRIGQLLDPRVEQLFAEEIPSLIMDMSSNPVPVESLPAYAQVQGALAGLEPALPGIGAAVTDLIRMGRRGRRRSYSIRRARDRLNHLLRDAQQPFFVCARLRPRPGLPENWGDLFYVLSYRIRACRTYRCSDRRFAVLELARIDELNVVENYLGMTEQRETSVAVFADRLAAFMEGRLHGVLQRGDLVGRIARRALGELAPGAAIEEGPQGAVGCALREGLTRHELHHRWAGLDPDPPNWLWAALAGFADESVHGVTAEIGAYLGEMRTSPAYARLRLALMLDALESPAGRSGIHGRARAFAVGGLLLSSSNQLFPSAQSELDRAAVVLDAIDDSTLIARIDALHEKVFGQPTPVFEPVEPEERKDGL